MRALFLPRYGQQAGSSRYMSYDYLRYYEMAGINCTISPLLDDIYLDLSRASASVGSKRMRMWLHLLKQVLIRAIRVLTVGRYDVVVLEKDVLPYLPDWLERLLFAINPRVVVMYDEPLYAYYQTHPNTLVRRATRGKVDFIMRRAAYVVAWNDSVRDYALNLNAHVARVSTGIDLARYLSKTHYDAAGRPIRLGWIGSPSGFAYLHEIDDVLARINAERPIELCVVSSQAYSADGFPIINQPWSIATEVDELLAMDIGMMPLPDTEWAVGKSGCKLFQYMGVALPVVTSPVGINGQVIEDGRNGYLVRTSEEWYQKLKLLMFSVELRQQLGQAGRQYVVTHNSQAQVAETLIGVVRQASGMPV